LISVLPKLFPWFTGLYPILDRRARPLDGK
jgi:hypothetical protein